MTVTWGQIYEALDISTRGIWPLWTTRSSDPSGTWLGLDQEPLRHFITSFTCYIESDYSSFLNNLWESHTIIPCAVNVIIVYFSLHSAHMDTLCLHMLPVVFVYMESLRPSRTPCVNLVNGRMGESNGKHG